MNLNINISDKQGHRLNDCDINNMSGDNNCDVEASDRFVNTGSVFQHVAFISYGYFDNNSYQHISGFASELASRGYRVTIFARGQPECPLPGVSLQCLDNINEDEFVARLVQDKLATIVHAWTPRESVRRLTEACFEAGVPYFVHLEDDEALITRAYLDDSRSGHSVSISDLLPDHVTNPSYLEIFLSKAAGVTAIVKSLTKRLPLKVPRHVLQPGVDSCIFNPSPNDADNTMLRSRLGLTSNTLILMYSGSSHRLVREDISSLCVAVSKLRFAGYDVVLLWTGGEKFQSLCDQKADANGLRSLGRLPRSEYIATLKAADAFVQPGWRSEFNVNRLPSKVLEYLATGRPTITAFYQFTTPLQNNVNALILRTGGWVELANAIAAIYNDPLRAAGIGVAGRAFAQRELKWFEAVDGLEIFYKNCLSDQ